MFYARGDDFFQIANVYECPDSVDSVHSSVWGIDCDWPHAPGIPGPPAIVTMGGNRLTAADVNDATGGYSAATQQCFNFNKLGGRENDPPGCAWAYSYVHDQSRNFYAQHEVMGYLEKDTCVKRDFWTACSRMSIEDQLYGLAFASETDQDLCMQVTCARRWSEVEDALAESCTAADRKIALNAGWSWTFTNAQIKNNGTAGNTIIVSTTNHTSGTPTEIMKYELAAGETRDDIFAAINNPAANSRKTVVPGYRVFANTMPGVDRITFIIIVDGDAPENTADGVNVADSSLMPTLTGTELATTAPTPWFLMRLGGHVDLYINVRVSNGHPKALDTILRVRFTVLYHRHLPSALNTWNTRASTAASGVINSGVVGDAPEGGKQQSEDTTVAA